MLVNDHDTHKAVKWAIRDWYLLVTGCVLSSAPNIWPGSLPGSPQTVTINTSNVCLWNLPPHVPAPALLPGARWSLCKSRRNLGCTTKLLIFPFLKNASVLHFKSASKSNTRAKPGSASQWFAQVFKDANLTNRKPDKESHRSREAELVLGGGPGGDQASKVTDPEGARVWRRTGLKRNRI